MLINCQCHAAKVAPNTNRHNFASNNLEYNKLKAPILTLQVLNLKVSNCIMNKICISKFARYVELKNSEIEFLRLLCCLKQIAFFGSFDELKTHQLF